MVNVTVTSGGTSGPRGSGWLSGAGVPASSTGFDGDFYLDTTNVGFYYGPKTSGAWGGAHAFGNSLNGVPLTNVTATTAPTVANDNTQGYSRGSYWINTLSNAVYVCTNAATGAALWQATATVDYVGGLPSGRSTGLISGGVMTAAGTPNNAFNITQAIGVVADYTTNPSAPTITKVTVPAQQVAITGTYANRVENWWVADSTGAISALPAKPGPTDRRRYVALGTTIGVVGTGQILTIVSSPTLVQQPVQQFFDLTIALGSFNASGNEVLANGANLSINKSAGIEFAASPNYGNDPTNPNYVTNPAETPVSFHYMTRTSGSQNGPAVTVLDPANYDVGGVVTPVGGGTGSTTIQRVFLIASGIAGNQIYVQYGQTVYSSFAAAQNAVNTGTNYIVNPDFNTVGVLLCWIIMTKGATNLQDPTTTQISDASKFSHP